MPLWLVKISTGVHGDELLALLPKGRRLRVRPLARSVVKTGDLHESVVPCEHFEAGVDVSEDDDAGCGVDWPSWR